MARKTRLHVPDGVYHVMLKGNGEQRIFFTDQDRCRFYLLLQEGIARFDYRVHGFCLLDNHFHLLIQVGNIALSKLMQNLAFRYTRWVNRSQDRVGHLFQGRYRAILIDQDHYLLDLVRYIHLNPVRAGLVEDPADYGWSGHRTYLGQETLPWLTTDWTLSQLDSNNAAARQQYRQFVLAGIGVTVENRFHLGGQRDTRILGTDGFVNRILAGSERIPNQPPPLDTVVQEICQAYGLTESQLTSRQAGRSAAQARALAGLIAMQTGADSLTAVSTRFNRDVATLSTGIRRLTTKIQLQGSHINPWGQVLERFNVQV
ncbi:MAG: transposase [Candidatus Competibacteraceae bacterium]|jgi:REP element-mobilizing transposase RayT|nr:transposase [Candidatus Competibacteraceae bacterium]